MSTKKTIRIKVLNDLNISIIFKAEPQKEVKLILPDVVKERWEFKTDKAEAAFAGLASAIGNEYIAFGMDEEVVARRLKTLVQRSIKAGLLRKK